MMLTRRELPVLVFNLIYIPLFIALALRRSNHEFLLYVAIILVIGGLILWRQQHVRFPLGVLWGLSIWGLLHMAGGNVSIEGDVLYNQVVIPIVVSPPFVLLRYDQLVHAFGFGVTTVIAHHLLRPSLRLDHVPRFTFWFLVVLMGCGFGALNEIIEFIAVLLMPATNVGGYENTLLDLVFNMIGAVMAAMVLSRRRRADAK